MVMACCRMAAQKVKGQVHQGDMVNEKPEASAGSSRQTVVGVARLGSFDPAETYACRMVLEAEQLRKA